MAMKCHALYSKGSYSTSIIKRLILSLVMLNRNLKMAAKPEVRNGSNQCLK